MTTSFTGSPPEDPPLGPVGQIGLVVTDIVTASRRYGRIFGIGSWLRYTYGPRTVPVLEYRHGPGEFTAHIALGGADPQIELIEPVDGPSVYDEHLRTAGEGLHHVGVFVDSVERAAAAMAERGHEVIQAGRGYGLDGDGAFAYFDTLDDYQVIIEAIERPARRRPSLDAWDLSHRAGAAPATSIPRSEGPA
ncbi:VOC family protein [Actinomadura chibensis]|uniref:VOC family protein n=1 Tax=Actinomadura chibensis TaxID=392828 RepID=A0A5D0N714_9ACTN|nr:VOC family protein [Actinomadura chibensis]TYB40121.1 VOC family protein [Actinomadura chibensis]